MPKPAYHHGDLPQQIHQRALATLREQGEAAITLRTLASQLGVSATALYRHVTDRQSLLAELAIHGFRMLRERLLAVPTGNDRHALIGIGRVYVRFARDEPNLYRLMFSGHLFEKGSHPRLDAAGLGAFGVLENTVARAQQNGYLKPAPLAVYTAAAWSLVHGLSQLIIDGHLDDPDEQLATALSAILIDGTHTRPDTGRPHPTGETP
ncbi:transcriptional regulator [Alcanivorax hongdengensis A-11-3]|uniref:Transcriptional regulator n=1 Tax=Alcanivorax hongdengensis A-11-3 TaxID=1177179 RepID=L0WDP2_9GAMM|nr:TetR/AcrR family transcriptional regulator [Alcanivorax hongdengensis]EKF74287.1 transcriptional regulator [Alcanivorax hongdengensis A-11-3]